MKKGLIITGVAVATVAAVAVTALAVSALFSIDFEEDLKFD